MSSDFIIRLIGTIVFCILGVIWGYNLGELANTSPVNLPSQPKFIQFLLDCWVH